MAQSNPYEWIVVESYKPTRTSGLHGPIHVRPVAGQGYSTDLQVECSRSLVRDFPLGTRFRLRVKLTDRESGGEYLYSYWGWAFDVLD
jgi:hypothetical protein